jgi:hypothetical protein
MFLALGKVLGCAFWLSTLTLFLTVVFRNSLIAILSTVGLWHISNLLFDFAGLPDLTYIEIVRTLDKVLGGLSAPGHELIQIAWMFGFSVSFAVLGLGWFITRDPPK